ncbi:hypothetical protein K491DRAFT_693656 [Lophiostoma macrostomum CBS 122681]|uniref:Secreted protein n=1 Tax=Lophiostoma macrostomum CBS 122681 TaxID=1314788 RepID=A0A6A6T5P6_9PLEO|nr:hypothetical protein K491DRAFT_693656 [Lophiostoma macrostomum CBS 122681]
MSFPLCICLILSLTAFCLTRAPPRCSGRLAPRHVLKPHVTASPDPSPRPARSQRPDCHAPIQSHPDPIFPQRH